MLLRLMKVQLLSFAGCPNVESARRALRRALETLHLDVPFEEVDVRSVDTPAHLRAWGSPTILVNGVDVAGGIPSGDCCRLYPSSEFRGAPAVALIEDALRRG
jgi:hypothetical protein